MARRKARGLPIHGWLCLDKPQGMTSTQAVNRVRRITGARKVGHGGTLDPLATGDGDACGRRDEVGHRGNPQRVGIRT